MIAKQIRNPVRLGFREYYCVYTEALDPFYNGGYGLVLRFGGFYSIIITDAVIDSIFLINLPGTGEDLHRLSLAVVPGVQWVVVRMTEESVLCMWGAKLNP